MLSNSELIHLPTIMDSRGNISFFEGLQHLPFSIDRVSWFCGSSSGKMASFSESKKNQSFIVALSGWVEVTLESKNITYLLNKANQGLLIPANCEYKVSDCSRDIVALFVDSTGNKKLNSLVRKDSSCSSVCECKTIKLAEEQRGCGCFVIVEPSVNLPFDIQRIYYLYDIPDGKSRGDHAHRDLQQLLIAVSGSFIVTLDDGFEKRTIELKNQNEGLFITSGIWRELSNFSSDAVCLVLASLNYDEKDYFRTYNSFLSFKGGSH